MAVLDALLQSSSSPTLLGALLVLLLIYLVSSSLLGSKGGENEPPGPRPLPIIGNILMLSNQSPPEMLRKLTEEYGSVFTFHMGMRKVVMLAGYKVVKEALVKYADEFGERQPLVNVDGYKLMETGVLWTNGDNWKEMRRFALTNLRDFGMGKRACEDKVIEECQHLIEVFKTAKGEPLDMTLPTNLAVSNIICAMVYGSRFDYEDPVFPKMVNRVTRIFEILGSPWMQVSASFSITKWILPFTELGRLFYDNWMEDRELTIRLKETLNPLQPRGLVDAFLLRQEQEKASGGATHFNKRNLLMVILDLFAAGTETSSTTLRWGLLFMVKYPKIQEQVREELSRVVGSRQVLLEDRKNLPFTDACVHETQRMADIGPMSLPRRTTRDITFQGYSIKKGTTVYPLLTTVLRDQSQWERPYSFHPGHFLDEEGRFVKRDAFMPFSTGRRACLGESLARMELFIFFSTLLQHFRFTAAPGVSGEDLDLTPRVGLTLTPPLHLLCAVPCV